MFRRITSLLAASLVLLGLAGTASADNDRLERQFRDAVAEKLPWPGARLSLKKVEVRGPVPDGPVRIAIREEPPFGSAVRGWIKPADGRDQKRPAWINAEAHVRVPVLVTTRQIEDGKKISETATQSVMRSTSELPHRFISRQSKLEGKIAQNRLPKGTVITPRHLTKPVVVESKQRVTVRVKRGAVVVETTGIAQESAKAGQSVRVRTKTSDSAIRAVATKEGTVEVP